MDATTPGSTEQLPLAELAALVELGDDARSGADGGLAAIRLADELGRRSRDRLGELVGEARSRGIPWQSIGDALGVSRQAAFKRFGGQNERETMPRQTIDLMERTHEVFRNLDAGDYEAVRENMTYTCARVLGKRKLMGVWDQVASSTGRLEACADSTVRTPDGSNAIGRLANRYLISGAIVQTTLRHEAGEWIGRVAYNGSGRITGILIAPPGSQDLPF